MLRLLTLLALAIVIYMILRRLAVTTPRQPHHCDAPTPSREEALATLGLAEGASREEIVAAHRQLIQKLHPDRGGNAYLAAQINRAKDILLE